MKEHFFIAKPVRFVRLLLDTNMKASIFTQTSFRSGLLHGTNLETFEPRSYFTDCNLASLGATACYKPRDI